jgi:hypothetical protein
MGTVVRQSNSSLPWDAEATAVVEQAKCFPRNKLEQLVLRLQRHADKPRDAAGDLLSGMGSRFRYRRWSESEINFFRKELVNVQSRSRETTEGAPYDCTESPELQVLEDGSHLAPSNPLRWIPQFPAHKSHLSLFVFPVFDGL